jgi:2,5-diketo-D-gluconate reductase B
MATLDPIGIGTWENDDPEECAESIRTALEMGYRHVDTAEGYGNEAAVGEGIARADVPREELFLATKVASDSTGLDYDSVIETAEGSLERLGVDVIDLLYVHWPMGDYDPEETLGAFLDLKHDGLIRNVGISNFEPDQVEEAMDVLDGAPFANQVEMHPFCQQDELVAHADEHGYDLVADSPLARGNVLDHDVIVDVAEKHDATPARVALAWLISKDPVVAIPKASSEEHIRDNWSAQDLELDPEDLDRIDDIERQERCVDYPEAPWHRDE